MSSPRLSGWSFSWQKDRAEKEKIQHAPDGFYYTELEDGTGVRLHGAEMSSEVRFDFIHDQVLRLYGRVRQILDTFSLFAVSEDFEEHTDAYPPSLRMVLADKEWYRSRFPWQRMNHGGPCPRQNPVAGSSQHLIDSLYGSARRMKPTLSLKVELFVGLMVRLKVARF